MKKFLIALCCLASSYGAVHAQHYTPSAENLENRAQFSDSRFGIFLHWGLYSMFAQGEWYMTNANLNSKEYAKSANAFYPHNFDAKEWVSAIKGAGAKYICFTTRHHEGFSMWNTKCSDYNIMNTPYGKDIVAQLANECHRQDVKLHLYYSLVDWTREDYPAGFTGRKTKNIQHPDFQSYYHFMNAQLTELLTNYGEIGAIWFDGEWDHDQDSIPFNWQFGPQYDLIHRLQPGCLVGNNHHKVPREGEDIQIFERDVPGENKAGLSGQSIGRLPLETCQTMNGMWGYKIVDQNYKSTKELIQLLVRTAAKSANLLLNVGPQPDGRLPEMALLRLKEIGEWMNKYGESIYGTEGGTFKQGDEIVTTQKGRYVYIHVLHPGVTSIAMPVTRKVEKVEALSDGEQLQFLDQHGQLQFRINSDEDLPDYVVKVTLK